MAAHSKSESSHRMVRGSGLGAWTCPNRCLQPALPRFSEDHFLGKFSSGIFICCQVAEGIPALVLGRSFLLHDRY